MKIKQLGTKIADIFIQKMNVIFQQFLSATKAIQTFCWKIVAINFSNPRRRIQRI
jgi:hypothetical protein